jgi:hypothetical protein
MTETPRPWSELRILGWFLFFLLAVVLFGPAYFQVMRPTHAINDFLQEWVSARCTAISGSPCNVR